MAFVDTGQLGYYTLKEGWYVTVSNTLPELIYLTYEESDSAPGQWYRAAPWLDADNSPGVSVVIGDSGTAGGRSGEALSINDTGKVVVGITVKNVGKGTAAVGFEWLSAPQLGE
jgi:hypothetical protein